MSNATTTTKDVPWPRLIAATPDKIVDKITLKRSITAPGHGRDRRYDACYAQDIDGNVMID
jgi:hypothetical protein